MAYLLNGVNNQIYTSAGITGLNSATQVSLAFTITRQATGAVAFAGVYEGTVGFCLTIDATNTLYAVIKDGATVPYFSSGDATTTTNSYLVVYNGGGSTNADKLKVYRNGSLLSGSYAGTMPSSLSSSMSTQPFRIGRDAINNRWSNTIYSSVALWGAALTAEEAVSLKNGFPARRIRPSALMLDARLARDVLDFTGKSSLTLQGGSVAVNPRIYG